MHVSVDPKDPTTSEFVEFIAATSHRTLSLERSPLIRIGLLSNRYRQLTSQRFRQRFQVGAMGWRMLSVLTRQPRATSTEVGEQASLDKAAVSRSLRTLLGRGLVTQKPSATDARALIWELTPAGQELHDEMLADSLEIHELVLAGLTDTEIQNLITTLNKILSNLDRIEVATNLPPGLTD
jgi:DNA-binding MarR family transcriptional regulator